MLKLIEKRRAEADKASNKRYCFERQQNRLGVLSSNSSPYKKYETPISNMAAYRNTETLQKFQRLAIRLIPDADALKCPPPKPLNLPTTFNDENIEFKENQHLYVFHRPHFQPVQAKYSVTQFIEKHFHFGGFNAPHIARIMIEKKNYQRNPVYDFVPRDRDDDFNTQLVLMSWETKKLYACNMGTAMHQMIEEYFQTGIFRNNPLLCAERKSFIQFLHDYQNILTIYGVEMRLFDQCLQLAGSIDALFVDQKTGDYILVDWKRCGVKSYVKRTICDQYGIFYCDSKLKKYIFQLNIYRNIIEVIYKKRISKMYLYIFDINDTDGYKLLDIERLSFVDKFMSDQRLLATKQAYATTNDSSRNLIDETTEFEVASVQPAVKLTNSAKQDITNDNWSSLIDDTTEFEEALKKIVY